MKVPVAHFWLPGDRGQKIQCAVFGFSPHDKSNSGLSKALNQLTRAAMQEGLAIHKSALVYEQHNEERYFGTQDLVEYLANNGVPPWTNNLEI